MKMEEIGKRPPDQLASSAVGEIAFGKSGVQTDLYTTVDADHDYINVISWDKSTGNCNKDDVSMADEQECFDSDEEDIGDPFMLMPSANPKKHWYWNRPYDVLLRLAIARCKRGRQGATRQAIFNHIRKMHPQMKYKNTQKGVGRALKRMIRSGHIMRTGPGKYLTTAKGRSIKSRVGYRFNRTIKGQYNRRAYARSKRPKGRRGKRRRGRRSKKRRRRSRKRRRGTRRRRRCKK